MGLGALALIKSNFGRDTHKAYKLAKERLDMCHCGHICSKFYNQVAADKDLSWDYDTKLGIKIAAKEMGMRKNSIEEFIKMGDEKFTNRILHKHYKESESLRKEGQKAYEDCKKLPRNSHRD